MIKVDTLAMFTSEIEVVELNTLRDEMTIVIPADFVIAGQHPQEDGSIVFHMARRGTDGSV